MHPRVTHGWRLWQRTWRRHLPSGTADGGQLLHIRASQMATEVWMVVEPDPKVKSLQLRPILSGWHFYGTIFPNHNLTTIKLSGPRLLLGVSGRMPILPLQTEAKIQIAQTITGVLKTSENLPRTTRRWRKLHQISARSIFISNFI